MSDVQTEGAAPASTPPADIGQAVGVTDGSTPGTTAPEGQPPVDNDHVAEGAEQFPTPATAEVHPANEHLDEIDALASHWGGDVWNEVRNLVAKVRSLL